MTEHCPHCRSPLEMGDATLTAGDVVCPACGSSIRRERAASTIDWAGALAAQRIGPFELQEKLGVGAFGAVYRAHDTKLDRTVALKIPRPGSIEAGSVGLDRFAREARSVAQLRHPSIVAVHEVGVADGQPYIVSEYVAGITLADYLTSRKPTFSQAAELVAQLAEALHYAHDHGVVHRDVKPSNILLQESGIRNRESGNESLIPDSRSLIPLLTDFGLAKRDAGEITMTLDGQVLGTPAYMSPEQARGEAHRVDGRSDEYSLGVILYELLTGELPFRGNTRMILHQVLCDDPAPLRKFNDRIPRDLETMCLKCLQKQPAKRYAACGDLAADLQRYLNGEPIKARPIPPWTRAWKWARRRPTTAALLVVISLSLLALLAGGLWFTRELQQETKFAREQEHTARAQERAARENLYLANLLLAQRLYDDANIRRVLELLDELRPARSDEEDLRGFEWFYFRRLCQAGARTVRRPVQAVTDQVGQTPCEQVLGRDPLGPLLVQLYDAWGKKDQADAWRKKLAAKEE